MKKLLTIACLSLLAVSANAQFKTISTNIVTKGTYLLTTNIASVFAVTLTSDKAADLQLYDWNTLADPYYGTNYVNAAYPYNIQYKTNFAYSYVGNNGFTNWYTNIGLYTLTLTNAANTNQLPAAFGAAVGASAYAVYPVELQFQRGIVLRTSTNLSVTINYR